MSGCHTCGRIYAPGRAPAACGECGGDLALLALVEALALARGRQDRLRAERVRRVRAMPPANPYANPASLADGSPG